MNLEHFKKLFAIDCSDKIEKKDNGTTKLNYLSWTYAWAEVKKNYPNAKYEILKFDNLPYVYDEKTGYMVFTKVEIEGIEHEMWLPVMDSANKAMKNEPYEYYVKKYNYQTQEYEKIKKEVQAATMFDINKTIMRCLTKNLAMFGLGLYIYAGEDLPEDVEKEEKKNAQKTNKTVQKNSDSKNVQKKEILIQDVQKDRIKELYTTDEIKELLIKLSKSKLSDLTLLEASNAIKAKMEVKNEGNSGN